jgi:hypothetical protein
MANLMFPIRSHRVTATGMGGNIPLEGLGDMRRRKGELSTWSIDTGWPHQVALPNTQFSDPEHAQRFASEFGGEMIDPKDRPRWPNRRRDARRS